MINVLCLYCIYIYIYILLVWVSVIIQKKSKRLNRLGSNFVLGLTKGGGGCSQGFGVAPRFLELNVKIYPTFSEKSFKKGTLKQKKIANFSPSSLWQS